MRATKRGRWWGSTRTLSGACFRLLTVFLFLSGHILPAQTHPAPQKENVEAQVSIMLAKLTLEQKVELLSGSHTWFTRGQPAIGLPALRMSDGPAGLRMAGFPFQFNLPSTPVAVATPVNIYGPATSFPDPIGLAASWDPQLIEEVGASIGEEARSAGVQFLLAPGVNIARAPVAGRNFEYMGEDPYLAGQLASAYIRGIQSQHVCATVKHFALNNQEYDRHNASSDADEATIRELYLPAFEAAVKEGHVCAVMDSYNPVNGVHATQDGWLNNEVLRKEWGFDGLVMSDWDATYDGVAAANNGLDLEMPAQKFMTPAVILQAVRDGKVQQSTIDDKVRDLLRVALRYDLLTAPPPTYPRYAPEHRELALKAAEQSIVLLKNSQKILPLNARALCNVAVIGPNAWPPVLGGGGSAGVEPYISSSILVSISDYFYAHAIHREGCARVLYDVGIAAPYEIFSGTHFTNGLKMVISSEDPREPSSESQIDGLIDETFNLPDTQRTLRWSGLYKPTRSGRYYLVVKVKDEDKYQLFLDGKQVPTTIQHSMGAAHWIEIPEELTAGSSHSIIFELKPSSTEVRVGLGLRATDDILSSAAKKFATQSDVTVTTVGFDRRSEYEGADRTFHLPWPQDDVLAELNSLTSKQVVLINSGGAVAMSSWLEGAAGLLQLWYPGQEGGKAVTDTLFGLSNPSGKLPVSFEKIASNNPTYANYQPASIDAHGMPHILYKEGRFVGYRYYTSKQVQPAFPFGYGLSYTDFILSDLKIASPITRSGEKVALLVEVLNSGKVEGSEVVQVYVGRVDPSPSEPQFELKAFQRVSLDPGAKQLVHLSLNGEAFRSWDEKAKRYLYPPGKYVIYVGTSSQNIYLHKVIEFVDK